MSLTTYNTYLQAHQSSVRPRSLVEFTAACPSCGRDCLWTAAKVRDFATEYDIACCQEVA